MEILKDYKKIFNESLELSIKYKSGLEFYKRNIRKKIEKIYLENISKIDELILFINPIGKKVTEYNPDEDGGIIKLD